MTRRLSARALIPLALIALAVACTVPPSLAAPPVPPRQPDIFGPPRVLGSFAESAAKDVNALGVVVGSGGPGGNLRTAWRADGDGPAEPIDPASTGISDALAINRHGVIAGFDSVRGKVWYPDGRTVDLPVPPVPPSATAPHPPFFLPRDINDNGLVVGAIEMGFEMRYPAVWNPATGRSTLLSAAGCPQCWGARPPGMAEAVNNRGQIIGTAFVAGTPAQVVWNPIWTGVWGRPQKLPLFDATTVGAARDINDEGTIVGDATRMPLEGPRGPTLPVVWSGPGFQLSVLPTPGGGPAMALGINTGGTIVGMLLGDTGTSAFRWGGAPSAVELPGLGGPSTATAISDTGVIVGEARSGTDGSRPQAVRWDPTH